jgi:hypothetical protein
MMAWLALKLAINWQRRTSDDEAKQIQNIHLSERALLTGVVSLCFAAFGGAIARGEIFTCWIVNAFVSRLWQQLWVLPGG